MTQAERKFREKYPHARVTTQSSGIHGMPRHTVYAGDYVCAEALSRGRAFKLALQYEEAGDIQPDPAEMASAASEA